MEKSAGHEVPFVVITERRRHSYNWEYLAKDQEALREKFGEQAAHPDPDTLEEFNRRD